MRRKGRPREMRRFQMLGLRRGNKSGGGTLGWRTERDTGIGGPGEPGDECWLGMILLRVSAGGGESYLNNSGDETAVDVPMDRNFQLVR